MDMIQEQTYQKHAGRLVTSGGSWALLGQDPHLMGRSLSPTLGHQPQVSVLELSVSAWEEGSMIPKPGWSHPGHMTSAGPSAVQIVPSHLPLFPSPEHLERHSRQGP